MADTDPFQRARQAKARSRALQEQVARAEALAAKERAEAERLRGSEPD
jgi:hypothetical protein